MTRQAVDAIWDQQLMIDSQSLPSAVFETEIPTAMEFNELHLVVVKHRYKTITEALLKLSRESMHVDSVDANGRTPLWWAAWRSDRTMIQKLLDVAADPNHPDKDGVTPVHPCAGADNADVLRIVMNCKPGPDLALLDKHGRSAAHYVCEKMWDDPALAIEMLKTVDSHGGDVLAADLYGRIGLHRCAVMNNMPVARWLLKRGCDIDGLDDWGKSALVDAAVHNRRELLALLVEKSAVPADIYGEKRDSSLQHFAARHADARTIRVLHTQFLGALSHEMRDGEGNTPDDLFQSRAIQADASTYEEWSTMMQWLAEDSVYGSEKSWIFEDALETQTPAAQCWHNDEWASGVKK
jgi:ankyrin repeat protein